ncbi:MAG: valine--tRNA ligase, partial [Acidobacteriota bacterium]
TEELWQRLPHRVDSISLTDFVTFDQSLVDERAEREMGMVIELITKLRNIRSTFHLSPTAPLRLRIAPASDQVRELLDTADSHIRRLAKMEEIELVATLGQTKQAARAVIAAGEIAVPLEGLIDFDKERERLQKELAKMEGEQAGLDKRLANPDFIARAAADVVASSRERSAELADQIARLRALMEAI